MSLPWLCRRCGTQFKFFSDYDEHFEGCSANEAWRAEMQKPPLGVMPRRVHDLNRLRELVAAVSRYTEPMFGANIDDDSTSFLLVIWTQEAAEIAARLRAVLLERE